MREENWSEEDLIYLAGYLDGEGCFWLGPYSKIGISCSNTHRPTIEWLHKTFGGSFHRSNRKRKENHRTIFTWQVVSKDADAVCRSVAIYLKEKAPQALLLLAVRATVTKNNQVKHNKLPDYVKEERIRLTNILKGMKHVPW